MHGVLAPPSSKSRSLERLFFFDRTIRTSPHLPAHDVRPWMGFRLCLSEMKMVLE
jgi:hypothetical protein